LTKAERIEALENALTTVLTRQAQASVNIADLERKVAVLEAAARPPFSPNNGVFPSYITAPNSDQNSSRLGPYSPGIAWGLSSTGTVSAGNAR
jgi:hypothetical protein